MSTPLKTATTTRGKPTASLPAAGVPYFTPAQVPPAGTAQPAADKKKEDVPTLFTPLTIRGVTLANRFAVAPMCMYSADDGHLTDYHVVHLGQLALHGAALTIVEATAVTPNGRISPEDSGLWQDSQVAPLRRVADFVHAQGHKIGVQLAHAGRKASTLAPWLTGPPTEGGPAPRLLAGPEANGWADTTWAPSAVAYAPDHATPLAMTKADIVVLLNSFASAARRAIEAGIDVIEIHGAHGYLLTEFLSPLSNKRTDEYGGSFENRIRLLKQVIAAVRENIPDTTPLFLRLSATEWMETATAEPSWTVDDTIALAKQLPALGVDLLDVSSGGNHPDQQLRVSQYYQIDLAAQVRKALADAGITNLRIGTVGQITTAAVAAEVVQKGGAPGSERVVEADLAIVGRQFLREPEFILRVAHELGVPVRWPNQYLRAKWRAGTKL